MMSSRHQEAKLLSFLFIFLLSFSFISAPALDNPNIPIVKPAFQPNITVNISVDTANKWATNLGILSGVDPAQFSDVGGTLTILFGWIETAGDAVWCELTGCTMSGDINMDGNDIINVGTIQGDVGNFTDIYVSNSSIYIGDNIKLSASEDVLNISGGNVSASHYYGSGEFLTDLNLTGISFNGGNITAENFIGGGATFSHIDPINYIQFNSSYTPEVHGEALMHWNSDDGTLEVGMPGGDVRLQIGQEMMFRATNNYGSDIENGKPVIITGAAGNNINFGLVNNSDAELVRKTIGLTTQNISDGQRGYITTSGFVRGFDTSAWAEGDFLFIGANDGELTNIKPAPPLNKVRIGVVTRSHATEGSVYVSIDKGMPLYGINDVNVSNAVQGSLLVRDENNGVWTASLTSKSYINSTQFDNNKLFETISDTRGTPQFLIQDGGPYQASFITRSFMVVNQNNTLLNSSQNNDCRDWGFVHLDCNTATTGADFGVTDDIESIGLIYADEGLRSHASDHGSYLVLGDRQGLYKGSNGVFYDDTNTFCDFTANNFNVSGSLSQWIVISDESSDYNEARADVNVFINSSCIELEHNPSWNDDFGPVVWGMKTGLNMVSQTGGFFEYYIGDDVQSGFKIKNLNATSANGVLFDTIVGRDHHSAFTISVDMNNHEGVIAQNIYMYSSKEMVDKDIVMLLMEGDASHLNNSRGTFIDMKVIGAPIVPGSMDGIHMPSGLDTLIEVGAPSTISSAYHNEVDITSNVTDVGNDVEVFTIDNDVLYIGNTDNFTSVSISLSTDSSSNIDAVYYYCNSDNDWELLAVTDTTDGFKISGTMEFGNPNNRGVCNKELDGTPFVNTNSYSYIALQRTRNNIVIPPVVDRIDISGASANMFMTEDLLRLHPVDTAPEVCSAGNKGAIYFDVSEDDMCVCKSSGWFVMLDGSVCT